jgi:hypothetical protein
MINCGVTNEKSLQKSDLGHNFEDGLALFQTTVLVSISLISGSGLIRYSHSLSGDLCPRFGDLSDSGIYWRCNLCLPIPLPWN